MSKLIFNLSDVIIKLFLCAILFAFFAIDLFVVDLKNKTILITYTSVMFVSLLSLFLTIFPKLYKIALGLFIISFTVYIYMYNNVAEIVEQHNLVNCLNIGKVYDPNQKICRTDCWKWDEKLGCLKE